ncbi:MAG TPA: Gfo/Idh/MocA family oxidoreductase [Chloroflexota bacterium]|nr:Gfo/Idh/MocA family oxidoreductase [Chloroflexota bacterium]
MAEIRVGVLGLVHDHVWGNLRTLAVQEGARLVAVADPNPPLIDKVRAEYAPDETYGNYEEMLEKARLDAVFIFADNASAAPLTEMATARGLHVMTEKPMAATLAQADRMFIAARQAGTMLMVNWPTAWNREIRHAFELAIAGEIGDIYQVKYRSAHGGPKEYGCSPYFYEWLYDRERNGAGAYMDYCCYGVNIARYLLGMPSRVMAMANRLVKEYVSVDDTGIIVMQYPRAIAVAEASWTQVGAEPSGGPIIYGTRGTLIVRRKAALGEGQRAGGGQLDLVTNEYPYGKTLVVPTTSEQDSSGPAYFLECLRSQKEPTGLCGAQVSRDTQEILEAGLIAARRGSDVSLPLGPYASPV